MFEHRLHLRRLGGRQRGHLVRVRARDRVRVRVFRVRVFRDRVTVRVFRVRVFRVRVLRVRVHRVRVFRVRVRARPPPPRRLARCRLYISPRSPLDLP